MTINDLIDNLPITLLRGNGDVNITELVEDSRHASPSCFFIARPGTKTDGRKFIADAIKAGAVGVLAGEAASIPDGVTALVSDDVPMATALLAERFFGHPTSHLKLIGITGTNGKTTTAHLVHQLLNANGIRCGLIGTVQIDDGAKVAPAELTTPPAIELSRLLRSMVDHGCRACVMETSSHALHQKRTAGLNFHVGVFTNLTGDHLDYHQTMESYRDAKRILFQSLNRDAFVVVNIDDPAGPAMLDGCPATPLECSQSDAEAKCHAAIGRQTLTHIESTFHGPWGSIECDLPLIGRHNVFNAMQALAVCHVLGLNPEALRAGIERCKAPPGRLEPVTNPAHPFAVLVDYAHTDDALENVLRALRPIVSASHGKLRVVFGCGGDRDCSKRPRMARVACKYADDVIITSDNPRTEDPQAIVDEVFRGVPDDKLLSVIRIIDRAEAIRASLDRARPGDLVLIAGKGHEDYQIIGTVKRPFDDRLVAVDALRNHRSKVGAA